MSSPVVSGASVSAICSMPPLKTEFGAGVIDKMRGACVSSMRLEAMDTALPAASAALTETSYCPSSAPRTLNGVRSWNETVDSPSLYSVPSNGTPFGPRTTMLEAVKSMSVRLSERVNTTESNGALARVKAPGRRSNGVKLSMRGGVSSYIKEKERAAAAFPARSRAPEICIV